MKKVMRKTKQFLIEAVTCIVFSLLGAFIGSIIGGIYYALESRGMFVNWELLDSPIKFKHIQSATYDLVYMQSEDGKYYRYQQDWCEYSPEPCKHKQWLEVSSDEAIFNQKPQTLTKSECVTYEDGRRSLSYYGGSRYSLEDLPKTYPLLRHANLIECLVRIGSHPDGWYRQDEYYMLLDDGNLWLWKHEVIAIGFIGPLRVSVPAGAVLGLLVWLRELISSNTNINTVQFFKSKFTKNENY